MKKHDSVDVGPTLGQNTFPSGIATIRAISLLTKLCFLFRFLNLQTIPNRHIQIATGRNVYLQEET